MSKKRNLATATCCLITEFLILDEIIKQTINQMIEIGISIDYISTDYRQMSFTLVGLML